MDLFRPYYHWTPYPFSFFFFFFCKSPPGTFVLAYQINIHSIQFLIEMLCITILQLLIGLITKLLLALKQLPSSILKEYVSLVKRPSALQCHRLLQSSGGSVAHKTRGSRFCSGPLPRQDAATRFCWEVSSATQLQNQRNPGCRPWGHRHFQLHGHWYYKIQYQRCHKWLGPTAEESWQNCILHTSVSDKWSPVKRYNGTTPTTHTLFLPNFSFILSKTRRAFCSVCAGVAGFVYQCYWEIQATDLHLS